MKENIQKGERNGKGKEYNNDGKLKFEGEYLNGQRIKGKEYYENGKISYEGEYSKGERSGKGKEYYNNGKLKYEGVFLNGKILYGKGYNKRGKQTEIKKSKVFKKNIQISNNKIFK